MSKKPRIVSMALCIGVLALLVIPMVPTSEGTDTWWDTDWLYRMKLTLNNSAQNDSLDEFPAMVRLTSSNFEYAKASADGSDLRFVDDDDLTELQYHYEYWNYSGTTDVWVNVTTIDGNSTTDYIWLYYGNPDAADAQDEEGTWNAGYCGVYHLNEETGDVLDSTHYDNDGSVHGDFDRDVDGVVDTALEFNGVDTYVNITETGEIWNCTALSHDSITVSCWFRAKGPYTQWLQLIARGDVGWGNSSMNVNIDDGWVLLVVQNESGTPRYLGHYGASLYNIGDWVYFSGRVNATHMSIYVNDNFTKHVAATGGIYYNNTVPVRFGVANLTEAIYNGTIDEVRFSSVARSEDWLHAEYLTMTDQFITFGAEEHVPPALALQSALLAILPIAIIILFVRFMVCSILGECAMEDDMEVRMS